MAALSHQIQTGPTQEVSVQTNSQQSFGSNNAQTAQLTSFSTGSSIVTTMASEGLSTLVACTKDDPRPQSVHVLQSNLQSLVGVITKVDGWYGNQTTTAVTKFLASRGQNGSGSSVSTTLAAQIDQAMAQKQEAQRIASSVYLSMVQRGVTTLFPVSSKPPQPDSIVQKVQEFLKGQGLYKFGADGWYGARTAEAVKKYQEDVIGVGTGNIDISTAQLIDFARNVSTEPAAGSNQTGNQNSTGNAQGSSQGSSNTASPVTGPKTETSKNWMSMPLLSQMTADGISRLSPVGQYHYGNAEAPDSVWIAQKVLKDKEYGVSKVDGWYGNQTGRAVEAIRRAYNLPVGASVRNVLDAQVAQVIDFIRGMAPPLQQGNQAGNTTGSSENASNSGGSGNSSSTVGQSTGTAEILNEIAYLQTRLSSGNSTTLQQYNVYYNSDNSATSDHDGTYLKNHMLGHGIKKLMPEANDVGVDDIQRFQLLFGQVFIFSHQTTESNDRMQRGTQLMTHVRKKDSLGIIGPFRLGFGYFKRFGTFPHLFLQLCPIGMQLLGAV